MKSEHGAVKEYPFAFGTNKDQAKARLSRVPELWAEVIKIHQNPEESFVRGSPGSIASPEWIEQRKVSQLWSQTHETLCKRVLQAFPQLQYIAYSFVVPEQTTNFTTAHVDHLVNAVTFFIVVAFIDLKRKH